MTDQPSLLSGLITKAVVEIEGQTWPIPMELVVNDDTIRRSFVQLIPWASNAKIEREEKEDTLIVKFIKQLGTKGYGWQELIDAPAGRNSAVEMYLKLRGEDNTKISPEELLELEKPINDAITKGEEEQKKLMAAIGRLRKAEAVPAPFTPLGM